MKENKKSFLFYQSWKTQIDILDDSELRKFINNLLSYHDGGEVVLESKYDKLLWNGVLPGLEVNNLKYQKTIERNRENGKKGGRPKKEAAETEKPNGFIENLYKTDGFKEKPKKPDNSKVEIDNSKREIDNSIKTTGNRELNTENCKDVIVETEVVNEYQQKVFDNWRYSKTKKLKDIIQKKYPGYPQLLSITTEEEIIESRKKVPDHIWNKVENNIKEIVEINNSKLRENLY
ncbi:hypothetical protein SAMN04487765_0479 [Tenacibaculum sp. MAR_2010_89]|uniref:DUF6291 domain-containing protein n=1 Tax=Tenacibaculum sp. MAR_2010_89 TaxID=1250198 RepID=UPI0008974B8A|nr:DUF6291 domain-containing protein [Tenacibaculum sp. MAR_2010_89]SED60477.1 hypothetical protein SAMN04487765_0479 [Tenacibaculum sp. MAR_2010_89]